MEACLSEALPEVGGPLLVEQFPGGHSNLTYLLRAGEQEFVLRRPPIGVRIKSAHDMGREYRILSRLGEVYAKVPRALLFCDDETVLGAPFYVMERVEGIILRSNPPENLDLSAPVMRGLSEALVDNLVVIHALDYEAAGLGDLGKPEGYIRRQIEGWTKRYDKSRTDDIPSVGRVTGWLTENMPDESGASLIHNDYKYDNLVLEAQDLGSIVAILDWEMATLGDPLMDLGSTLAYWLDPDDPQEMQMLRQLVGGLTVLPGNMTRGELVQRYAEQSGRDVGNIVFYYVYALFKVAVIVQQLYFRYKQRLSTDKRLASLNLVAQLLCNTAALAIEKERVDGLAR